MLLALSYFEMVGLTIEQVSWLKYTIAQHILFFLYTTYIQLRLDLHVVNNFILVLDLIIFHVIMITRPFDI